MKSFNLSKLVGAGVLVASLATLPLVPASAQNGTVTDSSKAAPGDIAVYENGETDKSERTFDWGWVGLLGLLGLAGRLAKHDQDPVYRHNQTNPLGTTEESVRFRDPEEINRPVITEESLRYRDPQETNHPSTDGSNRRGSDA